MQRKIYCRKNFVLFIIVIFLLICIFVSVTAASPKKKIVLAGSSSIYYWDNAAEDLLPHKVVNLGIRGSTTSDWNRKYYKKIVRKNPDIVILYIGGNDFKSGTATVKIVANDIQKLITKIRKQLPKATVYYVSINPTIRRFSDWNMRKRCNAKMRKYCADTQKVIYIETARYCFKNGKPNMTLYRTDNVHFNQKGYTRIWKSVVAKKIKKQLK